MITRDQFGELANTSENLPHRGFRKWGPPPNHPFWIGIFHEINPSLGYLMLPPFMETPRSIEDPPIPAPASTPSFHRRSPRSLWWLTGTDGTVETSRLSAGVEIGLSEDYRRYLSRRRQLFLAFFGVKSKGIQEKHRNTDWFQQRVQQFNGSLTLGHIILVTSCRFLCAYCTCA